MFCRLSKERREALLLHEEREKLVRHIEDLQCLETQTMVNDELLCLANGHFNSHYPLKRVQAIETTKK